MENFKRPVIQAALFANAFIIGVVLSTCLVKLYCRLVELLDRTDTSIFEADKNKFSAECMLIISSMLHLARSGLVGRHVNPDVVDRMWTCLVVRCSYISGQDQAPNI